ncbi:MAG: SGNH/GDSL hydrolase family protein [Lachnospiraceae bacterium]|nr:SGNH/GDSL hydrolase family protein [Lachnospiraceae bacterium]
MNKKSKQKKGKVIFTACFLICLLLVLWCLQRLVEPKYMGSVVEGAMIPEYYSAEKNNEVVFIGDCELYENISTVELWKKYGISSYTRGSAQQLIWQSYYLAEETLKYEHPKAIVFNVLSMKYSKPQREAYNRMTLDGMRWSPSKVKSILASETDGEHLIEYVFPLLRYHSRISSLTSDDFKYFSHRKKVTFNGYYMRVDTRAAKNVPKGIPLTDYSFGKSDWKYLDKLRTLCEKNGTELILVKAPTLYPAWYDEWDEQIQNYADKYGLSYYNFLKDQDEIGLDYSTDTYDRGLHLNLSGAEKMADYFGNILQTDHGCVSQKGDKKLDRYWDKVTSRYEAEKERQYRNLKKYGNIRGEKK